MDEAILKKKCAFWLSTEVPRTERTTGGLRRKERSLAATSVTHLYCMERGGEGASHRENYKASRSPLASYVQSESPGTKEGRKEGPFVGKQYLTSLSHSLGGVSRARQWNITPHVLSLSLSMYCAQSSGILTMSFCEKMSLWQR